MSDAQGRATIRLYTPSRDGSYAHHELARGIPWDEARTIVLRLLGDQSYSHDVYMGDYYYFGERNPKAHIGQAYYYIFDPRPEIGEDGNHRTPAPERWLDPTVQS